MKKTLLTAVGLLICMLSMAQWSDDASVNNLIVPELSVLSHEFAVNKDGLTFVAFSHGDLAVRSTSVQILDKEGKKLFPDVVGIKLTNDERTRTFTMYSNLLFVDKEGNAIITVVDCRNSAAYPTQDLTYTIYKVSPAGETLWQVDLEQGRAYDVEAAIKIIQLEDLSYVFAWMRMEGTVHDIILQRLSKDGEYLWGDGLKLSGNYTYPYLVNSGYNEFILVYAMGGNQDLYARKMDFDGEPVWEKDTRIYRSGFPSTPLWTNMSVIPDTKGGVFVAWDDDRNADNFEDAYVSHVKSDGALGWFEGEAGLKLGYYPFRQFAPKMAYNPVTDHLFVFWRETNSNQSLVRLAAQKVNVADGELMWDSEGIELDYREHPSSAAYYTVQTAPGDQAAFFYQVSFFPYQSVYNYFSLLDGDGEPVLEKPVAFAIGEKNKAGLVSSPLVDNRFYLTGWEDNRGGNLDNGAYYMQRVNLDGTLGDNDKVAIQLPVVDRKVDISATLIKESAEFIIHNAKAGNAEINLYAVSGQKAATIYRGSLKEGNNTISWTRSANISSGVYIVTMKTNEGSRSTRVIIN